MMLFQAPLSGGLETAEGAGEVLDAVVNVPATSSWLYRVTKMNGKKPPFDLVLTVPAAGGPLPQLPTAQAE